MKRVCRAGTVEFFAGQGLWSCERDEISGLTKRPIHGRPRPRLLLLGGLFCAAALIAAGPASAQSTPQWTIAGVSNPTNFAPGDSGDELVVIAINTGQGIAEGATTPITITDTLPAAGVTLAPAGVSGAKGGFPSGAAMACQSTPTIACTTTEAVIPGDVLKMVLTVDVAANAPAVLSNQVSIEGGGAPEASATTPDRRQRHPRGLRPRARLPARRPLQHRCRRPPDLHDRLLARHQGTRHPRRRTEGPHPRPPARHRRRGRLLPAMPARRGHRGNLPAGNRPRPRLRHRPDSPGEPGTSDYPLPIYNVAPTAGEPAAFAFDIPGHSPVRLDLSFAPLGGYHLRATIADADEAQPLLSTVLTLWGIPADLNGAGPSSGFGGAGPGPRLPLLTNPTSCGADPLATMLSIDAWADPGVELSATGPFAPTGECACRASNRPSSPNPTRPSPTRPPACSPKCTCPRTRNPTK